MSDLAYFREAPGSNLGSWFSAIPQEDAGALPWSRSYLFPPSCLHVIIYNSPVHPVLTDTSHGTFRYPTNHTYICLLEKFGLKVVFVVRASGAVNPCTSMNRGRCKKTWRQMLHSTKPQHCSRAHNFNLSWSGVLFCNCLLVLTKLTRALCTEIILWSLQTDVGFVVMTFTYLHCTT